MSYIPKSVFQTHIYHLVRPTFNKFIYYITLFMVTNIFSVYLFMCGSSYASYFTFMSLIPGFYTFALLWKSIVREYRDNGGRPTKIQRYLQVLYDNKITIINSLLILSLTTLLIFWVSGLDCITINTKYNIKVLYSLSMLYLFSHILLNMRSWDETNHLDFFVCVIYNIFNNTLAVIYYTYIGLMVFNGLFLCLSLSLSIGFSLTCYMYSLEYFTLFSSFFEIGFLSNCLNNYYLAGDQFNAFSSIYEVTYRHDVAYDNFINFSGFENFFSLNLSNYLIISNQFEDVALLNMASSSAGGMGEEIAWTNEDGLTSPGGGGPSSGGNGPILPLDTLVSNNDSNDNTFAWWYELFDFRVKWHGLPFRCDNAFSGLFNMEDNYTENGELIINPVTNHWLSFQESAHVINAALDANSELFNTPLYSNGAPFGLQPSDGLNSVGRIDGWDLKRQIKIFLQLQEEGSIINVVRPYYPTTPDMDDQDITERLGHLFSRYRNLYHSYVWFAEQNNLRPGLNPFIFEHAMYFIERADHNGETIISSPNPTELERIVMNVYNFFELTYGQSSLNNQNYQTCLASDITEQCIEQALYVREAVTPPNVKYIRDYIPYYLRNMPQNFLSGDVLSATVSQMFMLIVPLEYDYRLHEYHEQVINHHLSSSVDNSPSLLIVVEVNNTPHTLQLLAEENINFRRAISISSSPILQEVYKWGNPFAEGGSRNPNV